MEGLGNLDDMVQSSTTDDGIHYKYNDIHLTRVKTSH